MLEVSAAKGSFYLHRLKAAATPTGSLFVHKKSPLIERAFVLISLGRVFISEQWNTIAWLAWDQFHTLENRKHQLQEEY